MKSIKIAILCGGKGTRLREHTEDIPKPLVEIGGRPILWHVMKIYSHYGFKDFILCLGYKADMIKDSFAKEISEWKITFVDTGLETNTGGRIKKIEPYIEGDDFFVTYADAVSDIDLNLLLDFHKKKNKIATMTCVNPISQFGIIRSSEDGVISEFKEKPRLNEWINGGFFVFRKDIFKYLEEDDILEKDAFGRLIAKRQAAAYRFNGFWACMDTYKDTLMLDSFFKKGDCPWIKWEQ